MIIDMLETIILLLILISVYGFARGATSLAPWVPTNKKDYERINALLLSSQGKKFIDLGCGTAGLLFYLAKKNPERHFTGVEIALPLFIIAWIRAKIFKLKNISIYYRDLFYFNLSDFDIFFVYGYPRSIKNRLAKKIKNEAKLGTLLISQAFKFHDFKLSAVDKTDDNSLAIFIYHL